MTPSLTPWAVAAVIMSAGIAWLPAAAQTPQSAADGVYSATQAKRGEALYAQHCAVCHGVDLAGTDFGPGLSGPELRSRWKHRSLGDLFSLMRTTMPVNSPGGLTAQQNADILAFMLQRAQFPVGAKDLPASTDVLNGVSLK